jgi:hypothetical protein
MIWNPVPTEHLNGRDDIRACVGRAGRSGDVATRDSAAINSAASGNSENFREIMLPEMLPNDAERNCSGMHPQFGADFDSRFFSREAAKNAKENLFF